MSASERGDPVAGPFGNLNQAYCTGLDKLAKGYEPLLKNAGRWNLELMGLMSRRAQAWLEVPTRISQCKSPQDIVREQLRFWQTAAQDYSEGAKRLTAAFGAITAPGLNGALGGKVIEPGRDYITVTETKPAAESPKRERRAA